MKLPIVFEPVEEKGFPAGFYYAHLPSLGLTTHGEGIDGARQAAEDLARLWILEKTANGESIVGPANFSFGTLEIRDDALQSA